MLFVILQLLDNFLDLFNSFCSLFFVVMKFLLGIILISIGIFTTMRLRGVYFLGRIRFGQEDSSDNQLTRVGAFVGSFYMVLGFGIVFNYAIYLFMFLFDSFPEPYLFSLIDMVIKEIPLSIPINIGINGLPYEKAIYYGFCFVSFLSFLLLFVSTYSLTIRMQNIAKNIKLLITSVIAELFFGFTIFMPLML